MQIRLLTRCVTYYMDFSKMYVKNNMYFKRSSHKYHASFAYFQTMASWIDIWHIFDIAYIAICFINIQNNWSNKMVVKTLV